MTTDETISALLKRVQQLEDAQAIRELKASYGMGSDRAAAAEMTAKFAPDGILEIERYGIARGKDEILQFYSGARFSWMCHYMVPMSVEVAPDGRTASGQWRLWELASSFASTDSPAQAVWIAGLYHDDFVKIDGVWKFSHVRLRLDLISPYEQGWLRQRFLS